MDPLIYIYPYEMSESLISPPSNNHRKIDQISIETINNDENTFLKLDINNDNTWEYEWDTSKIASLMCEGTYTIIACEGPFSKDIIEDKAYGTVSVILKKPFLSALISDTIDSLTPQFVSATVSQSSVAQGDGIYITGTASGKPQPGIQIWIFGGGFHLQKIVPVNPDGSYSLRIYGKDTKELSPGQYFVIVQHPMMNHEFDVYPDANGQAVLSNDPKRGVELFSLDGSGSKQGAEAAMALIDAMNSNNIDDIYTKLQFLIEMPKIQFEQISDKHIGEKFTIRAMTNLAIDNEIMIEINSSSFDPNQKNYSRAFSGIVKVLKGNSGMNLIAFDLDTSTFEPVEYIAKASAILVDVTAEVKFNII